ncbi:MAG: hypothetical protein GX100_13765 [candidate division WS1 bacterium]|nr:hypothetical protein [candidate division WS1 bacterium]
MSVKEAEPVLITALGVVTPWGLGVEALSEGVADDRPLPDPARCPEVDLKAHLPSEKTYLDRCSELALLAASLALQEAGLLDQGYLLACSDGRPFDPDRFGLSLGTAYGCLDTMNANTQRVQTKGARLASPLLFMHSFINAPASLISIEWGLRGPAATFTDGAVSFASALLWAEDLLRRRRMDLALVGGVEALSEPLLRAMVVEPELARKGVPMEAAAFFLLERASVAQRRGSQPKAEVEKVILAGNRESADYPPPSSTELGGRFAFGAHLALRLGLVVKALAQAGPSEAMELREDEGRRTAKIELRGV